MAETGEAAPLSRFQIFRDGRVCVKGALLSLALLIHYESRLKVSRQEIMRLGTKLVAVGIVLLLAGWTMPAGEFVQSDFCDEFQGPQYECETPPPEYRANGMKGPLTFIGSLLFIGGFGGWVGAVDADSRRTRDEKQEAIEKKSSDSDRPKPRKWEDL